MGKKSDLNNQSEFMPSRHTSDSFATPEDVPELTLTGALLEFLCALTGLLFRLFWRLLAIAVVITFYVMMFFFFLLAFGVLFRQD